MVDIEVLLRLAAGGIVEWVFVVHGLLMSGRWRRAHGMGGVDVLDGRHNGDTGSRGLSGRIGTCDGEDVGVWGSLFFGRVCRDHHGRFLIEDRHDCDCSMYEG